MDTISYNVENFQGLVNEYIDFQLQLRTFCDEIARNINTIESNWEGPQFELAKPDLLKIKKNLSAINDNSVTIQKILNNTAQGFSEIKYKN